MDRLRRVIKKAWAFAKKHRIKVMAVMILIFGYYAKKVSKSFRYTSKFLKLIEDEKIASVVIYGMFLGYKIKGKDINYLTHRSMLSDSDLFSLFRQYKVKFTTSPIEDRLIGTILIGVILPAFVMTWAMSSFMLPQEK